MASPHSESTQKDRFYLILFAESFLSSVFGLVTRKTLLVAASVFGLVGFASGVRAELRVDALAEEEVLSVFFERNLDLIASQYQIDKAEAQKWIAGAIPNPFFSVGMNELTGDFTFRPDLNAQGIGLNVILTQILETNGKRGLRQESSQIGREAVEMDFKDTVRILAAEVRRKFYDLQLAQKNQALARDNADRYERTFRANQIRHRVGDIAESDLVRVEIEGLKAKSEYDRATAALKTAQSELAMLINWPEKSLVIWAKEKWPLIRLDTENASETDLVKTAFEFRPDLKALSLRVSQRERA